MLTHKYTTVAFDFTEDCVTFDEIHTADKRSN